MFKPSTPKVSKEVILAGIIRPVFSEPYKHIINLIHKENYARYHWLVTKLRSKKRYRPFFLSINNLKLKIPDVASFLSNYYDIFVNQVYDFKHSGDAPVILDLGANIGLSILYFKQKYKHAKIFAFEADPNIFGYLQWNITENKIRNVSLLNKAAWKEQTVLPFLLEGGDEGRIVENRNETITVQAIDISSYLKDIEYDFVKIDIEGAEVEVLPVIEPYMYQVKQIFIEYHSWPHQPQRLDEILRILIKSGMRIAIKDVWCSNSPYKYRPLRTNGCDYQAKIFGWRE